MLINSADLSNFLFDDSTGEITGFIDFDCAHIHHPLHEFFSSFSNLFYVLDGEPAAEGIEKDIRDALLHGYPSPLPTSAPADTTGKACGSPVLFPSSYARADCPKADTSHRQQTLNGPSCAHSSLKWSVRARSALAISRALMSFRRCISLLTRFVRGTSMRRCF